ncbi:MAG: hypothetical protein AAF986_02090 [Pseudomonadota bacterium]
MMVRLPEPLLGISDLSEDESLIITVFREWRRLGPTRAVAEHKIAIALQQDKSHSVLNSLFELFNEMATSTYGRVDNTSLLTHTEESLLDLLSTNPSSQRETRAKICTAALIKADMNVRPTSKITRSGYDEALLRIAQSYQSVYFI